jgi:DNA-binding transcriptional regulator YiaG
MMKTETIEYRDAGFLVMLVDFPIKKVGKRKVLDYDLDKLHRLIALVLLNKPTRLTGDEVKFLRSMTRSSLNEFASWFGITKMAVKKWEDKSADALTHAMDFLVRHEVSVSLGFKCSQVSVKQHVMTLKSTEAQPKAPMHLNRPQAENLAMMC